MTRPVDLGGRYLRSGGGGGEYDDGLDELSELRDELERLREERDALRAEIKAATFAWADHGLRMENDALQAALKQETALVVKLDDAVLALKTEVEYVVDRMEAIQFAGIEGNYEADVMDDACVKTAHFWAVELRQALAKLGEVKP